MSRHRSYTLYSLIKLSTTVSFCLGARISVRDRGKIVRQTHKMLSSACHYRRGRPLQTGHKDERRPFAHATSAPPQKGVEVGSRAAVHLSLPVPCTSAMWTSSRRPGSLFVVAACLYSLPIVHSFTSYANDFVDPQYILSKAFPWDTIEAQQTIIAWANESASYGPWSMWLLSLAHSDLIF